MDGRANPKCRPKPCRQCEQVFTPRSNGQWYCSNECTFRANYAAQENGCWEWRGVRETKDGYGVIKLKGRVPGKSHNLERAHRFSFTMHHGPIPEGFVVRHTCDNPSCVNPDHLEVGTHAQNTNDAVRRRRHYHGEALHTAKLTEQDVLDIRASALSNKELAVKYGLKAPSVWGIRSGKSWKHLLSLSA